MAELITTDAEKASASYLNWDDAALGKMCKWVATIIERGDKTADPEGKLSIKCSGAAMILISMCRETNAGTLTLDLAGHSSGGIETGDWRITVKRKRKPSP